MTGPASSDKPLLAPLQRAARQVTTYLERHASGAGGLHSSEGPLVAYLLECAPCSVAELVAVFGYAPSTLTSLLARLEHKRLITRQIHPADRRSFMIGLTETGIGAAALVRAELDDLEARIGKLLKPAELAAFEAVLKAIAGATRRADAAD